MVYVILFISIARGFFQESTGKESLFHLGDGSVVKTNTYLNTNKNQLEDPVGELLADVYDEVQEGSLCDNGDKLDNGEGKVLIVLSGVALCSTEKYVEIPSQAGYVAIISSYPAFLDNSWAARATWTNGDFVIPAYMFNLKQDSFNFSRVVSVNIQSAPNSCDTLFSRTFYIIALMLLYLLHSYKVYIGYIRFRNHWSGFNSVTPALVAIAVETLESIISLGVSFDKFGMWGMLSFRIFYSFLSVPIILGLVTTYTVGLSFRNALDRLKGSSASSNNWVKHVLLGVLIVSIQVQIVLNATFIYASTSLSALTFIFFSAVMMYYCYFFFSAKREVITILSNSAGLRSDADSQIEKLKKMSKYLWYSAISMIISIVFVLIAGIGAAVGIWELGILGLMYGFVPTACTGIFQILAIPLDPKGQSQSKASKPTKTSK